MSRSLKTTFFVVSILIGLLVLVLVALRLFLDVSASGRLSIDLFPGLIVNLENVHLRNRGTEIAVAKEVSLAVALLPLLHREIRIKRVALGHLGVSIERDRDGRFNLEKSEAAGGTPPALNLEKVTVSDGALLYADKRSGNGFEAKGCSLDANRLRLAGAAPAVMLKHLSFAGDIACGDIRAKGFTALDLRFSVAGQNGIFDLKPFTMTAYGGQGSGGIRADFTGVVPLYDLRYALSRFHIEELVKSPSSQQVVEGEMDFAANLVVRGKTMHKLKQTLEG
jgi:AsmA protein